MCDFILLQPNLNQPVDYQMYSLITLCEHRQEAAAGLYELAHVLCQTICSLVMSYQFSKVKIVILVTQIIIEVLL